ncbi:hypothetical protein [Stratiformator vulcanicus]|uniref:Uncharacterized protein n=1 Tax=Stratiformator vulcanicus TaxID=2527980 RepID=A0A517QWW6_9PLAN|nr:hypothetical protein [Stratiformator vulcanicus]QDT36087.1 hypothetical protein Pan189_04420 [Stratiformator vulcanicus]
MNDAWLIAIGTGAVAVMLISSLLLKGSRLLAYSPKVSGGRDFLIARTPWTLRALSLLSYRRLVIVDAQERSILIRTNWLWVWPSRRSIGFDEVAAIQISADDWNPRTDAGFSGDQIDALAAWVRLHDSSRVMLARFVGAGNFQDGHLDGPLLFPVIDEAVQGLFDAFGSQGADLRDYVNRLEKILDVPLERVG